MLEAGCRQGRRPETGVGFVLNLTRHRRSGAGAIPGYVTTLSVSWLNRQFKAVAIHRGSIVGQWEHPLETEGASQFEQLLRLAIEHTGFKGQTVSLVLAHPRLIQQALDVPPVKNSALRKILQRQAQQQKMFPGEAAWTSQTASLGKEARRVIMHLLPRPLLHQLVQGCHNNGLYLTSVTTPSGVLQQQLRMLPLEKGQVALLAAETGGSTTVVIGRTDGQVLFARTLGGTWNENPEQLATDLNRTVLFFNEQFGLVLNRGIWLFGPGAEPHAAEAQRHTSLPVAVSPANYDPFYWAVNTLKVRPALLPNFISPEMQQAPRRQVLAQVVAVVTSLVVVALLALSAYATIQSRQETHNIQVLSARQKDLAGQRLALQQRNLRLARRQQVAGLVLDDRLPPVPLWFYAYLSEAVPPELAVTNLHLVRELDVWKVHLAGTLQPSTNLLNFTNLARSVSVLTSKLTNAPFHLRLSSENQAAETNALPREGGIAAWVANVAGGVPAKAPPPKDQFVLEGVMR
jgi:hypothetical protein